MKYWIFLISSLVYLLISFFLILVTSATFFMSYWNGVLDLKVFRYQYFERDHLNEVTSLGIVSLTEEFETNEFLSYTDYNLQKEILISPFGTDEYECFGSCFCSAEDEDSRRTTQNYVLINSVSYLLAAASSVLAINMAKEYFSEKCDEKYSNICESKSIESEVEKCKKVIKETEELGYDGNPVVEKKYFCYGNCVEKAYKNTGKHKRHLPTPSSVGIVCSKLKQEGEVVVYSNDLVRKSKNSLISSNMQQTARVRFQQKFLKDFCKKRSEVEYSSVFRSGAGGEKIFKNKRKGYVCSGRNNLRGKSDLHNVACRVLDSRSGKIKFNKSDFLEKKKKWDLI